MKRSRAFILQEQLVTMVLQAGFILVLCMSFYMLTTFYAQTQQIMTARNHAERVISFLDNKIRYAGLGLWRCGTSKEAGSRLASISMLGWTTNSGNKAYRLPVSLKWYTNGIHTADDIPLKTENDNQKYGNVLTLLYAQKDLSSGGSELILTTAVDKIFTGHNNTPQEVTMLDSVNINNGATSNIKNYTVAEAVGVPMCVDKISGKVVTFKVRLDTSEEILMPAASELMYLNCMQMFVHGTDTGEGRQFAYRELQSGGTAWDKTYNQEKGILEIYMERDNESSTFTLYVLATGGYDESLDNKRPETWPDNANPRLSKYNNSDTRQTPEDAKTAWENSSYRHHIVYVSRASWKLNNLEGFSW